MGKKIHRGRTVVLLLLLLVSAIFLPAQEETEKSFELDNGLRVFLVERHTVPLVNLVFAVDCGSKDETDETNGIVHMLEHNILFRGTEERSGEQIAQEIRQNGAYFNAHTGRDLVIFEISLPAENCDFALALQKEIVFHLDLTQESLDEEKQVILEEISKLRDDAAGYARELVFENLFAGHPYGRPIFGRSQVIENMDIQKIRQFYSRFFVPENSSLVVLGDFDLDDMETKVRGIYGSLERKGSEAREFEIPPPLAKTVEIEEEMDVNLGYVVIGLQAPDYNHPDQYAVDVLTQILGSGISPMLYNPLSQRRLQINSLMMNYGAFKLGGALLITVSTDPKNLTAVKKEITGYFRSLPRENYSREDYPPDLQMDVIDYLGSAKNQLFFKAQKGQENGLQVASSLATHLLLNSQPEGINYLEKIAATDSGEVRKAADTYMNSARCIVVTIVPKKK